MLHVKRRDRAQVIDVKNAESVLGIEVCSGHSLILGHFDVLIKVYLFAYHANNTSFRLLPNGLLETPSCPIGYLARVAERRGCLSGCSHRHLYGGGAATTGPTRRFCAAKRARKVDLPDRIFLLGTDLEAATCTALNHTTLDVGTEFRVRSKCVSSMARC